MLNENYSFWTDEGHVAIFSRAILEKGRPILENGFSTGLYQWLQYYLSAFSAKIFGLSEFSIRFPSIIFGSLTIIAVYVLAKTVFNQKTAFVSSFFVAFLNIEILMSRQARPYQALQFFSLLSAFFIFQLAKNKEIDRRLLAGFLISSFFAISMHGLGLIIFFSGVIYLFLKQPLFLKPKKNVTFLLFALPFVYLFKDTLLSLLPFLGRINNLFYYRVFLSHNYLLFLGFAFLGILFCFRDKIQNWQLLVWVLATQILAVSFLLGQPFTRYFYPAFAFLIILASFGMVKFSDLFKKFSLYVLIFLVALVILAIPEKFSFFPKEHYSLNEDMQEVPEVDYKKIYGFVRSKLEENPDAVYISNWSDHPVWYLGEGKLDYLMRKNPDNLEADVFSGAEYIDSLDKLKQTVSQEKKGLVLLESWESELPKGSREFIRENLYKELEVDRLYPVQPRYWPVEVYSWGIYEK